MHNAELPELLGAALGKVTGDSRALLRNVWQCRIPQTRRKVQAKLTDQWLRFTVQSRSANRSTNSGFVTRMLRRNTVMTGRPRIIWNETRHQIVSEIPVDLIAQESREDLEAVVVSVLGELAASLSRRIANDEPDRHESVSGEALVQILSESGWSPLNNEDDIEVPLALSDEFLPARVLQNADGVTLNAALLPNVFTSAPQVCRDAVALLLWLTASRFRLVKPTLNQKTPALEVFVAQSHIDALALGHACAALSATAQSFTAAAEMLISDDRMAHTYLTNLGFQRAA